MSSSSSNGMAPKSTTARPAAATATTKNDDDEKIKTTKSTRSTTTAAALGENEAEYEFDVSDLRAAAATVDFGDSVSPHEGIEEIDGNMSKDSLDLCVHERGNESSLNGSSFNMLSSGAWGTSSSTTAIPFTTLSPASSLDSAPLAAAAAGASTTAPPAASAPLTERINRPSPSVEKRLSTVKEDRVSAAAAVASAVAENFEDSQE